MVVTTNRTADFFRPNGGKFEKILENEGVFLEPASDSIVALYDDGVPWGMLFNMFTNFLGLKVGDKIRIAGDDYFVRGVKNFDSFLGEHAEVVVRRP